MDHFWIICTGALVAINCGLLGCYLVLRKMTMLGDAISHAVLPGIIIAFLLSNSTNRLPMLIGASIVGVLTTVGIETLKRKVHMQMDAAIGFVFTFLFAVGVIMVSVYTSQIHLDEECVLHGELTLVPFNIGGSIGGVDIPRNVLVLFPLFLIILFALIWGYKGLYLTTFDSAYATSIGISSLFWHYGLMGLVSMTTVISFESVGAILVVAFLVGPAATAYLLVQRLPVMLVGTVIIGVLSAIGGYLIAYVMDASITGAMTLMIGILFVFALIIRLLKKRT